MFEYGKSRTRQNKVNIFNGNINACAVASDTTLLSLKSQLNTLQTRLNLLNQQLAIVSNLWGKVGGCFIGRTLTHWYEKYPNIKALNLTFGQSQYCEPNFIDATANLIKTEIKTLEATKSTLQTAIATEEKNYANAVTNYNNCLYLETEKAKESTTLATAQTTLTKANTEQVQVIAEAEEKSTMSKVLPFVIGAVVVGGGVYFFTKKKRR